MIDMRHIDLTTYILGATAKCANALMDVEASALINAAHYERSGTRTAYRNGYRTRRWRTEAGTVVLHIPKLRSGSYYPAFLDVYSADETFENIAVQALMFSTSVDDVRTLLIDPDDIETAHYLGQQFDEAAQDYLTRRLHHPYPTLIVEQDEQHITIYGERRTGTRHLIDVQQIDSGIGFWRALVRGWVKRGLEGVEQIEGSGLTGEAKRAIRTAFPQASHRKHFVFPQHMTTALGEALQPEPIDRNQPHGLLSIDFGAALDLIIDDGTLVQLRRMMRDQRDAIGEPLSRVA